MLMEPLVQVIAINHLSRVDDSLLRHVEQQLLSFFFLRKDYVQQSWMYLGKIFMAMLQLL